MTEKTILIFHCLPRGAFNGLMENFICFLNFPPLIISTQKAIIIFPVDDTVEPWI